MPKVVTVDLVSFVPEPGTTVEIPGESPAPDAPRFDRADMVNPDVVSQAWLRPGDPGTPAEVPVIKPENYLKSKPDNLDELVAVRKEEPAREKPVEKRRKLEEKNKLKLKQELRQARRETAKKELARKEQAKREQAKRDKAKREQARKEQAKREQEKREQAKRAQARREQAQLQGALDRMKASVASREKGGRSSGAGSRRRAGASGSGSGRGGKAGSLTLYQMVIKSAIEQNWVFNDAMAGLNQNLEVRIFIKILKSGTIRDISFETRSGNQYLDQSAKKAIQRANPLPELPQGMSSYELILGFSPRGLK